MSVLLLLTMSSSLVTATWDMAKQNKPIDASKQQIIFPGTKWCGQGNIATDDTDFGVFRETDMCCKNHDYCPQHIPAGETRFNLTNNGLFTKVHCDCEVDFHSCLKSTNSLVSQQVGTTYFDIVGSQCFQLAHPIVKCARYSEILITRCLEYELDTSLDKQWQFFDNQLY